MSATPRRLQEAAAALAAAEAAAGVGGPPETGPAEPVAAERAGPDCDAADAEAARAADVDAARLAASGTRSEHELAEALRERGHDQHVVDAAVGRARRAGLVDDRLLARLWVEDRGLRRGYGEQRLRRELLAKGVDASLVDRALEALAGVDDEEQRAWRVAEQWAESKACGEPLRDARRLHGYLARRGYAPGLAATVARRAAGLVD